LYGICFDQTLEQYNYKGITFEYVKDYDASLGGDEYAQKVASQEVSGYVSMLATQIDNIHVPLFAVIFYAGHCMKASWYSTKK
jgi:hypothetical protein